MAFIIGNTGDDRLDGTSADDEIRGLGGNDWLRGNGGSDILDGGDGFDTAYFDFAQVGVIVDANTEIPQDTGVGLTSLIDIEGFVGSAYNDSILLNGNHIFFVSGGAGFDTVDFSKSAIGLEIDARPNASFSGLSTLISVENVVGTNFDDYILGFARVDGGSGLDRIYGSFGNDILFGGAGADVIHAGDGSFRSSGSDRIDGGDGADRLYADGSRATFVFGGLAGAGDRVFNFQESVNFLEINLAGFGGAAGVADLIASATPVAASVRQALLYETDTGRLLFDADGNGAGRAVLVLTLVGAPTLSSSAIVTATIVGDAGENELIGTPGDDYIQALGGNDNLFGNGGNDALDGGAGFDRVNFDFAANGVAIDLTTESPQDTGAGLVTLIDIEAVTGSAFADRFYLPAGQARHIQGGDGIDTADYSNATFGVDARLGAVDRNFFKTRDELFGVENLVGSGFNDRLVGHSDANLIEGNGGADRLYGLDGNDTLLGGAGSDGLAGGPGIDRLDGGDGADRLYADGTADTFVFGGLAGAGDRLFGFVSGLHDLEIDASGFGGTTGAFALVASATPTPPGATQTFLYDTDTGKLFFDADGTGAGGLVHVLTLIGAPALAASDIVLV